MKKIACFVLLALLNISGFSQGSTSPQSSGTSAEDVCKSVLNFLNEMMQHNFKNYIHTIKSEEKSGGLMIRKYTSNEKFPQAVEVIINDTNQLQRFRSAQILMLEENVASETVSEQMKIYYTQANKIFKLCLEQQKFKVNDPAPDRFSQHVMSADYRYQPPSNNPFGNMQLNATYVAEVYVDRVKNGSGYKNLLYIRFKRG